MPPGFVRIRHYGLLANRVRQEKLTRVRHLLAIVAATPLLSPGSWLATETNLPTTVAVRCPHCAGTHWRILARLLPQRGLPPGGISRFRLDLFQRHLVTFLTEQAAFVYPPPTARFIVAAPSGPTQLPCRLPALVPRLLPRLAPILTDSVAIGRVRQTR